MRPLDLRAGGSRRLGQRAGVCRDALVFGNAWAVVLTLLGGYFFADSYRRTGSLRLVCVEHALYGNLIFTIGLGDYFCHASVGA